jgi:hypothetical protein
VIFFLCRPLDPLLGIAIGCSYFSNLQIQRQTSSAAEAKLEGVNPPRLFHPLRLSLCYLKGADVSFSLREGNEAQALFQIDGTLRSIRLGLNHQPYARAFNVVQTLPNPREAQIMSALACLSGTVSAVQGYSTVYLTDSDVLK